MRRVGATWVREETKSGSAEFKVRSSGCGRGSAGSVPALRCAAGRCGEPGAPARRRGGEGRGTNSSRTRSGGSTKDGAGKGGGGGGSVRARLCLKWGEGGGGGKKKRNNAAPDILCSKCALPPPSPRYLISVATAAKGSGELEESLHGGNFVLGERGGAVGEGWRGVGGRRGGARRGHYATCAERCAE